MISNLIIGAGQLGSRHLQGLLKSKSEQVIYVLDPSENSLNIAKKRAQEVEFKHIVRYLKDWDKIPSDLDLVIVATGANVRSKIVTKLLTICNVKNLVLEKILFQDVESYSGIRELITNTNTATLVNHPRRMFKHYKEIKNVITESDENVSFQVFGGNWDLACNALHFIDLFSFLSQSEVKSIDFEGIDNNIIKSKRLNCIEFTGTLKGVLKNGNDFNICSLEGDYEDITISVLTKSNRWIIQEGSAQKIIHLSKENNFNENITPFINEFQSNLTTRIINDLLVEGKTTLPSYDDACSSHIPFIKGALIRYSEITGINTNICPIT